MGHILSATYVQLSENSAFPSLLQSFGLQSASLMLNYCGSQGAGKGKRVMGGVPQPAADQAELKLEQLVDQRDMAVSMDGEAAEPDVDRRSEILALADVRLPGLMVCRIALLQECVK